MIARASQLVRQIGSGAGSQMCIIDTASRGIAECGVPVDRLDREQVALRAQAQASIRAPGTRAYTPPSTRPVPPAAAAWRTPRRPHQGHNQIDHD
jgi:hypothetical protein